MVKFLNCVEYEGIYCGGQPSESELRQAAEEGIKTVVNTRALTEDFGYDEVALADTLGLYYVAIPIESLEDITDEALDTFAAATSGPARSIIAHCKSGNRVGALCAMLALREGKSVEQALDIGRATGLTRMEEPLRKRLLASSQ